MAESRLPTTAERQAVLDQIAELKRLLDELYLEVIMLEVRDD